jgi:LysM repeat protein
MKDFLNEYVDKPIVNFIVNNPKTSVGIGVAALALSGYGHYRLKKSGDDMKATWTKYNKKYKDATQANIDKIRRASKLDLRADYVKPEDMERVVGTKDNAFFINKDFAELFKNEKGFKTHESDPKYGHVYYTDSTKTLPAIAHEYGHGESAYKGTAPTPLGNLARSALAGLAGLGVYHGLGSLGFGWPSSVMGGALASLASNYLVDKYTIDEEELASDNAMRYLKALKHNKVRLKEDEEMLQRALDTYKESRNRSVLSHLVSPAVSLGLLGGGYELLDRYMRSK